MNKKKVLIVDDQKEIRELLEITLGDDDYHIFKAKSGEDAIKLAIENIPELIIMDIMMPGKYDGIEALKEIKENPITQNCKIIMLTAKFEIDSIEKSTSYGATHFFSKPFSPLELIQKVEDVLSE